ncbi:MAG: AlpA family phage regulatory protein [Deltaproteobacteria bacterium]|nr:AlpA family phage regulatory protein [Deltaproteobacteria bacterium]
MRADDVVTLTGLAKSTMYRLMSGSQFPAAVKIGPRAVAWKVEEVQAWISELSRATYTPRP